MKIIKLKDCICKECKLLKIGVRDIGEDLCIMCKTRVKVNNRTLWQRLLDKLSKRR